MATFGTTTTGSVELDVNGSLGGSLYTLPVNGTLTKITAYFKWFTQGTNVYCGLYNSAKVRVNFTIATKATVDGFETNWVDFAFTDTLLAGNYWLTISADAYCRLYNEAVGATGHVEGNVNPANLQVVGDNTDMNSIYATYTTGKIMRLLTNVGI